ncbi:MAG TPA: NAD(P)/FAD-dependent oxidoreductase [Pyrinomonadaceae bacterium]|nr:NAD(P)/FAD-dependent oxidoreductase [Pyrinomonadaceae bacterium]
MDRVIIIGAGHNGLVTACYLAKAGFKPLVLERREIVGGACVTEEFHPGFRCSTLANSAGPLLPQIVKDLRLERHGVEFIKPTVRVLALNPNGPSICVYEDAKRTADELNKVSVKDAKSYPDFVTTFARIGRALAPLLTMTPPNIDKPTKGELWNLGKLGWGIRGLGKKDEYRLLRYGPMAVADLAAEWFETELLRATIAARGIFGAFAGPWSAGTSAALLLQAATDGHAIAPAAFVKGGMGALTQALAKAATEAGAEIRTNAEVASIQVKDGKAEGVVLANGEEIPAWTTISNADPGITLLELLDFGELEPSFLNKIRNYRAHGTVAKVHLALSALPEFAGLSDGDTVEKLSGRIHIGPDIDYLERAFDAAKYGCFSPRPYLDITIPSLTDPSLAPDGAHVMSIHVQFAPYKLKDGDWDSRREELGNTVVNALSDYAPNLKESLVARQVITPLDLEQTYGLSGGHIHHGEMSLDQLFAFRPLIGWAQYRTPIKGLYLCGAGTHPGGGVTGAPGLNASREIIKDLK